MLDAEAFCRQVYFASLGYASAMLGDPIYTLDELRASILMSNCTGQVRIFVSRLDKDIRVSFAKIKEALEKRFPSVESKDTRAQAYYDCGQLSQGNSNLYDYVERCRSVLRRLELLSTESGLDQDVAKFMARGLKHEITRQVLGSYIGQKGAECDFEEAMEVLKNAAVTYDRSLDADPFEQGASYVAGVGDGDQRAMLYALGQQQHALTSLLSEMTKQLGGLSLGSGKPAPRTNTQMSYPPNTGSARDPALQAN